MLAGVSKFGRLRVKRMSRSRLRQVAYTPLVSSAKRQLECIRAYSLKLKSNKHLPTLPAPGECSKHRQVMPQSASTCAPRVYLTGAFGVLVGLVGCGFHPPPPRCSVHRSSNFYFFSSRNSTYGVCNENVIFLTKLTNTLRLGCDGQIHHIQ